MLLIQLLSIGESYSKEWWEQVMEEADQETRAERFKFLEFWGYVDTELLKEYDIDIPKELQDQDQVKCKHLDL